MFCSNCGKNVSNGIRFCPACGAEIITLDEETKSVKKAENEPVYITTETPVTTLQTLDLVESRYREPVIIQPELHNGEYTEDDRKVIKTSISMIIIGFIAMVACIAIPLYIHRDAWGFNLTNGFMIKEENTASNENLEKMEDLAKEADVEYESHDGYNGNDDFEADYENENLYENMAYEDGNDDMQYDGYDYETFAYDDEDFDFEDSGFDEGYNDQENEGLDFVFPYSDRMYLDASDLQGLSAEECRIARNEIYARRGRIFQDAELQTFFEQFDWYEGLYTADEFDESVLNEYEKANRDLIVEYESEMGF